MLMRFSTVFVAAMLSAAALPADGQIGWSETEDANQMTIKVGLTVPVHLQQIIDAPYSGRESTQTVQTLPDGTRLTHTQVGRSMTYRDSMGRLRIEQSMFPNRPNGSKFTLVQVQDPVAGYLYVIDSANQIVHRVQALTSGPSRPVIPNPPSRTLKDGTEIAEEPLPGSTISGVAVVGVKTTTTYSMGSRLGNDRPVTTTGETWWAPSVGVMMSNTSSQPGGGVTTTTIPNFSTAAPDPALFTIPASYKVVDETGGFTIKIVKQ